MFLFCPDSQSVAVFEVLKRGLNNDIKNIAKTWLGKDIDVKDLNKIYQKITSSVPSSEVKKHLEFILNDTDMDNDGSINLQELIKYLNKEYGTFQFHGNKGNLYR